MGGGLMRLVAYAQDIYLTGNLITFSRLSTVATLTFPRSY